MHIPDGFLSTEVCAVTSVAAAGAIGYAAYRARDELDEKRVPLLGATAALVFALQMVNFPILGGTSGHLLGAALATVLLGPWLGIVVVSLVLGVQAVAFADGGIAVLGANVLNMAVLGALVTQALLDAAGTLRERTAGLLGVAAVASWASVMAAATATSVELALSGTIGLTTVLPSMLGVHTLIGVGEAAITVAVIATVLAARPDLVARRELGATA
ncbi:MAG: energy-coupling factor ABC transporter permease [Solirubrobacteraceae bacterium]|nr:energy-coupling factor ABC transporter permease [Solirubrobacteraceae bacterium]